MLRVQPTGWKAFKFVYSRSGVKRWYDIGFATLVEARAEAAKRRSEVRQGKDPQAERKALRLADTFAELAERYVVYANKKNKSWRQGEYLICKYLLPRLGKLKAANVTYADVNRLFDGIDKPVLANQVLATASAIFSWAVKHREITLNPCVGIDRNKTKSRERILSDSEVKLFWDAFDDAGLVTSSALKTVLLTGQRPGEISHMRREHIRDNWWEMPGDPVPELGWPGTKNAQSHRVWLSEPVQQIIAELEGENSSEGFVFATERGGALNTMAGAMRSICTALEMRSKVTPHDLRRTFSSSVADLFDTIAMNRLTNHLEGGITGVYDRSDYSKKNKEIMEAVARHLIALAEGNTQADNVVPLRPQAVS